MSNTKELREFLVLKDNDLLAYYDYAPNELQKMLCNIYKACYRFALQDVQTLYMLQEAIKPFRNELINRVMEE